MKTSMTVFTTILCLILAQTYPFQPQNLYALEFFVIGIASFLLALKPNRALIKGKFLTNTLRSTLPSGIAMFLAVAMTYAFKGVLGLSAEQVSTVAMFSMTVTGVIALWLLLFPFDWFNLMVGAIGTVGTTLCYIVFPWALKLIAGWFNKQGSDSPMFVEINGYAILFIALNALVMGGVIIGLKYLVKYIEKTRKVKAEINGFVEEIGANEIFVEESTEHEQAEPLQDDTSEEQNEKGE